MQYQEDWCRISVYKLFSFSFSFILSKRASWMSHQRSFVLYFHHCRERKKEQRTKFKKIKKIKVPRLFSTFVLISLLAHPLSFLLPLPLSLCLAGLIECLNKLINHWHWWKTDRPGEVMFIKLPPICFFNPCSRLFAEYAHISPFPEISLPWPRLTVHTLIHYLWFCIEDKFFFLLLYSQYPGTLIKNNE